MLPRVITPGGGASLHCRDTIHRGFFCALGLPTSPADEEHTRRQHGQPPVANPCLPEVPSSSIHPHHLPARRRQHQPLGHRPLHPVHASQAPFSSRSVLRARTPSCPRCRPHIRHRPHDEASHRVRSAPRLRRHLLLPRPQHRRRGHLRRRRSHVRRPPGPI